MGSAKNICGKCRKSGLRLGLLNITVKSNRTRKNGSRSANSNSWEQEALAELAQSEHELDFFSASLDNVHQRYLHANQELKKLHFLLESQQPELVYRMSYVHAVTVMEAYLMYCARALLEHEWPLRALSGRVLSEV